MKKREEPHDCGFCQKVTLHVVFQSKCDWYKECIRCAATTRVPEVKP
jgi:hypothetical protein